MLPSEGVIHYINDISKAAVRVIFQCTEAIKGFSWFSFYEIKICTKMFSLYIQYS
jgi:hypothetical protein